MSCCNDAEAIALYDMIRAQLRVDARPAVLDG
jgi:hypothetical protein